MDVQKTRLNDYLKPARRAKRIVGICADAERLGVTYDHLSRVLHGRRTSKRLTARYHALKSAFHQLPPHK